jgi:X-Pro dipeptidyl-peptidase
MRLASVALLGALSLLLPASAGAAVKYEKYKVPSVGGALINVEVARDDSVPTSAVLLTYSPYNSLSEKTDGTNIANDAYARTYAKLGIARARADVIGTRDSEGCWDYGGAKEQQSGVDVVEFLAGQPWSNGNVGMIGGSYDGTTATMVAAAPNAPKALKAIVPIAAISRWYGYAYQDGVRFLGNSENAADEGFDTPLAFDFGFGRTVGPGATPKTVQDRLNPCDSVAHTERGYDTSPDYDAFWLERDYRKDAKGVKAAALVAHGWQDYNVKQEEGTAFFAALPKGRKWLYLTQGTHGGGTSGAEWTGLLDSFLKRFLLGQDTDIETRPRVLTRGRVMTGTGMTSTLRQEADWPPKDVEEQRLFIRRTFDQDIPGVTLPNPGTGETGTLDPEPNTKPVDNVFTWVDTGAQTEEVTTRDPLNEPGHGYYSLFHKSAPLKAPMRIAGSVLLDGHFRTPAGAHLSPVLLDVAPDGTLRTIARGFLNVDYRKGLAKAEPANNQWVKAQVRFLPQDVTLPAGHRLGLLLQSSNTVWALPGTPGPVNIATGPVANVTAEGSSLRIPVAPAG